MKYEEMQNRVSEIRNIRERIVALKTILECKHITEVRIESTLGIAPLTITDRDVLGGIGGLIHKLCEQSLEAAETRINVLEQNSPTPPDVEARLNAIIDFLKNRQHTLITPLQIEMFVSHIIEIAEGRKAVRID